MDDAPGAVDAFVAAVDAWAANLETFKQAASARWLSKTREHREDPAAWKASDKLNDAGEKVVRQGALEFRDVQVLLLKSFGDYWSYEFSSRLDVFHVGRARFRRGDDLRELARAPVVGLGPISPTVDRDSAEIPREVGELWLARLAAVSIPTFRRTFAVADGTRCELVLDSIQLDWSYEVPPPEWKPLQQLAEDLVAMVNQHVDARSGSPT